MWAISSPQAICPWTSLVAQLVKNLLQCRRPDFVSWVGKIPWRRKWQPAPVFLPGESHGQRSLTGYTVHGVARIGHNLATKPPPTTTETVETGAFGIKPLPTQTLTLLLCVSLGKSYNLSNVLICRIRITVVLSQSCHEDKIFCFVLFSWQCLAACGILVPQSGIKPAPWQWKHAVLTTGPPGNSRDRFSNFIFSSLFFKINFYWSTVALPSSVSFHCAVKWISFTHTFERM